MNLYRIFAIPLLLAFSSIAGLLVGLLEDGWYDTAAWIGLGLPLAVIVNYARRNG